MLSAVEKSDGEWRELLDEEEFYVLRRAPRSRVNTKNRRWDGAAEYFAAERC